jgi:pimeloyl-ACP methyl ester carboxylesterase
MDDDREDFGPGSRTWTSPPAPERRFVVPVGAFRIHTVEAGAGPPLVLIHGLCGSRSWWIRVLPELSRRYRVLIPEIVGFGRTRCPGRMPRMHELADVIARWMEQVGATSAPVVGHSMGGQLAIHLAAHHPGRVPRLVLVDAAGIPRDLGPRSLARFAAELVPPRSWGDPLFLPIIARDTLVAGPRVVVQALGRILRDDVRPLLPRVDVPTLVIWGEHDMVIPVSHAHELRAGITGARLLVLPGAAHNPMVDRPISFSRAVLAFLAGEDVGS